MKRTVVAAFAVFASACGAAPPPESSEPTAEPEATSHPELADKEQEFMGACQDQMEGANAYCSCGWNLLVDIAGAEALANDTATRGDMEAFEAKIGEACVGELPPGLIEKQFMEGCTAGGPDREPFCRCSWDALREKLEPLDIARGGKVETPAFTAARDHAAATCKDLAVAVKAQAGFMQGCAKAPPLVPFCRCAWDVIRDHASAEDVIDGKADVEGLKPKIKATCQKHLPEE
jgi:hypothetical protein